MLIADCRKERRSGGLRVATTSGCFLSSPWLDEGGLARTLRARWWFFDAGMKGLG